MSYSEAIKDVLASTFGSIACVYTGQPFDTVKVRMQVQPEEFSGPIQCFRKTFQGEGIYSLWKGSVPALSGALGENMMAFGINGHINRIFKTMNVSSFVSKEFENVLSGALTGLCTAFILCPADIIKCRAQVDRARGGSEKVKDIMKYITREEGIKGFYRGFGVQICRDIPFYAFFFGTYDFSCKMFKKYTDLPDETAFFISGGFAGQAAWAASLPFDTIKSIVQTTDKPRSSLTVAQEIMKRQGIRGLFNGIEVALIRAFPANAALFLGYELSRKLMTW